MKINNLLNFNNKVILVTGCNGQLGNDISNFFLKLGSIVYGIDISNNKNIKNSNFFFKKTDISKNKKINLILKQILRDHKKIDIIINNAAKSFFTPFYKRTKREINETIDTNLTGPINIIKEYYKLHKKIIRKDVI